jgi:hypothetical protein
VCMIWFLHHNAMRCFIYTYFHKRTFEQFLIFFLVIPFLHQLHVHQFLVKLIILKWYKCL